MLGSRLETGVRYTATNILSSGAGHRHAPKLPGMCMQVGSKLAQRHTRLDAALKTTSMGSLLVQPAEQR
jgi:hypothetical protein